MNYRDESDWDSTEDWNEAESDDFAEDDDADFVDCPACHKPIYEDSERCPYCGDYVTQSTAIWANKPRWIRLLAWSLLFLAVLGFLIVEFPMILNLF